MLVNAVKSAQEFGIRQGGQSGGIAGVDHGHQEMGLDLAQGLVLTNAFYWDRDDETRAFSKRFYDADESHAPHGRRGRLFLDDALPLGHQGRRHEDAKVVMSKMREMPVNDFFAKSGRIREDGRMVHDMYVYEVKKPSKSRGEWDYYKLREVIPGEQASGSKDRHLFDWSRRADPANPRQPNRRRPVDLHGAGFRARSKPLGGCARSNPLHVQNT